MNKIKYYLYSAPMLASAALFAQETPPDPSAEITAAVGTAQTLFYTVLGLSIAAFIAGLIIRFAKKAVK